MNTFTHVLAGALLCALSFTAARGQGFTDSYVTFYGEVRQTGEAQTSLLQSGTLKVTFTNQSKDANRVTLSTPLRPTGSGTAKPYSYALKVPLAYLPEAPRLGEYLAIGGSAAEFKIEDITIDGSPATLPDGSAEFFPLSFASRADQYRLDLLVAGDSTDSDGDGLPDWWETQHGLDPTLADADSDLDGDGWSNLKEFQLGSDPAKSNLDPELATAELLVPELGQAGCHLQFFDSDTPDSDIQLEIDPSSLAGFSLRWSGLPTRSADSPPLTLASLQAGELTLVHEDTAVRQATLPISFSDGGEQQSATVLIRVTTPSTSDGNDAALWLDAADLSVNEPLASWSDRSGNGRHALQPVAENRPMVSDFAARRSVHFSERTSHLFFQNEAIPSGDHTILAAWQASGSRNDSQVLFSSNRGFLQLDPTAEAVSYPGAPFYQADGHAVRGYQSATGTTATSIFRREGSTLQNIFGLSYNGEEVAPKLIDPVLPTIGARRLALPVADPITNGFRGSLHELIVFPSALPEQKLRDVHDYLQSKWSGYVTWDFSTSLRPVTLTATGTGRHIIRGGHGTDDLRGGDTHNILSGGGGPDTLRGSAGLDTFVFGGVDTGRDVVIDFDLENDVIDLSALYWGQSSDAREFLAIRLDTNFSTPVPTLDTVLLVQRPDAATQEIVLRNTVLGAQELIELIVEGRIRMGGLTIPTEVALAFAPGSEDSTVLSESRRESFTVEVTRSGDGVAGALEVPIGLFQDALGRDFALEGDARVDGQRAVVQFARGESTKLITFHAVPDLESEGTERWETSVLPHFRYDVAGAPLARSVSDEPFVRLAVIEPNALTSGQAARVRVIRDGSTSSPLTVTLDLDGTALEGTHLNSIPRSVTIPAGVSSTTIEITTAEGWDGSITRMAMLRLVADDGYLLAHPHEATVYASNTAAEADAAGFDRWLTAATHGELTGLLDLLRSDHAGELGDYLRAYALGHSSPENASGEGLSFRLVGNRPELTSRLATTAADLHWQVQSTADAQAWTDVSATFTSHLSTEGLTLLGPPIPESGSGQLYRLNFSLQGGSRLTEGLNGLAPTSDYGMSGPADWRADPDTGHLLSTSATSGSLSRLIVQVEAPTQLQFALSVSGGDGSDRLAFSIDGQLVAETTGEEVLVDRTIDPSGGPVLLMWEFQRSSGTAVIATQKPGGSPLPGNE